MKGKFLFDGKFLLVVPSVVHDHNPLSRPPGSRRSLFEIDLQRHYMAKSHLEDPIILMLVVLPMEPTEPRYLPLGLDQYSKSNRL